MVAFRIVPKSPAWHRRLRGKRAKARLVLRLRGKCSLQASRRLAGHHGTCPYQARSLILMGKRGGANQHGQGWHDKSPGYAYWQGAWKSRQRYLQHQDWEQPRQNTFPAYDANWKEERQIVEVQTKRPGQNPEGMSFVQTVQAAINQARKLDGRVAAMKGELEARKHKWLAYKEDMQKAFVTERNRFHSDAARLEEEIAAVEKQQMDSYAQMKQAAITGSMNRMGLAPEAIQEWAALCNQAEQPDPSVSTLTRELMGMMSLLQQQQGPGQPMFQHPMGCGAPGSHPAPSTPPHRPSGGMPGTPPAVTPGHMFGVMPEGSPAPPLSSDPYLLQSGDGSEGPADLGSAARLAMHQRPKGPDTGHRPPVKHVVPPKPKAAPALSPSFAEKVEARRDALKEAQTQVARSALHPFGIPPVGEQAGQMPKPADPNEWPGALPPDGAGPIEVDTEQNFFEGMG